MLYGTHYMHGISMAYWTGSNPYLEFISIGGGGYAFKMGVPRELGFCAPLCIPYIIFPTPHEPTCIQHTT